MVSFLGDSTRDQALYAYVHTTARAMETSEATFIWAPFHTYCSSIAKPTAPNIHFFLTGLVLSHVHPQALEPGAPQALRSIVDIPTPRRVRQQSVPSVEDRIIDMPYLHVTLLVLNQVDLLADDVSRSFNIAVSKCVLDYESA